MVLFTPHTLGGTHLAKGLSFQLTETESDCGHRSPRAFPGWVISHIELLRRGACAALRGPDVGTLARVQVASTGIAGGRVAKCACALRRIWKLVSRQRFCRIGWKTMCEGDFLSIDRNDGGIYAGKLEVVSGRPERELTGVARLANLKPVPCQGRNLFESTRLFEEMRGAGNNHKLLLFDA